MVIDPLENVSHSISTLILNSSCFSWFGYQLKHVAPGNRRQSWILDSTPLIPAYRYWILNSLSAELGFWIPIVCGITDSLNCIPNSSTQKVAGLRNPDSLTWGETRLLLILAYYIKAALLHLPLDLLSL